MGAWADFVQPTENAPERCQLLWGTRTSRYKCSQNYGASGSEGWYREGAVWQCIDIAIFRPLFLEGSEYLGESEERPVRGLTHVHEGTGALSHACGGAFAHHATTHPLTMLPMNQSQCLHPCTNCSHLSTRLAASATSASTAFRSSRVATIASYARLALFGSSHWEDGLEDGLHLALPAPSIMCLEYQRFDAAYYYSDCECECKVCPSYIDTVLHACIAILLSPAFLLT